MIGNGHPIIEGAIPVAPPASCCEEFKRSVEGSEFGDIVLTYRVCLHNERGKECFLLCPYCGAELEASVQGDKKMKPEEVETVTRDAVKVLREAQCMILSGEYMGSLEKVRKAEKLITSIWW